jgi:hypothetical protein
VAAEPGLEDAYLQVMGTAAAGVETGREA